MKKNLSLLDELLETSGDSKYRMESLLRWYEHTMQALHKTDGEIDAFWHKYWFYDLCGIGKINAFWKKRNIQRQSSCCSRRRVFPQTNHTG